jgi:serine protease Do
VPASAAPVEATGAGAGGGAGGGVAAQTSPALKKSAAPSAGIHRGVRGSSARGEVASTGSLMLERIDYERPGPVKRAAAGPKRAIIRTVKRTTHLFGSRRPPLRSPLRSPLRLALALVCLGALTPLTSSAGPLAPLPGTNQPPNPAAPPPTQNVVYAGQQRISRGVTTVERNGAVISVGTVLSGDGRILTALSSLGASDVADVRYSDGSVVHAKIGHKDKAWDLALLVPLTGHWVDGLTASETDPAAAELKSLIATHPGRPMIVPARYRGAVDVRAHEGADDLQNVLDIEVQTSPPSVGAPLLDPDGGVVGVFVHACRATLPPTSAPGAPPAPASVAPCAPIIVAAPVSAIRHFLAHTPATAVAPAPWLGIVGSTDATGVTHGVRVMAVAPGSPAEKGGLKGSDDRAQSDLIVAVDAAPIDTPEKLADVIAKHAIGDKVKLLVFGSDGKFREVPVALRPAP